MTNKKIKNYAKNHKLNIALGKILNTNYDNISACMLGLNRLYGFGKERLNKFISCHEKLVNEYNTYSDDDVLSFKLKEYLDYLKMDYNYFKDIAKSTTPTDISNAKSIEQLGENLILVAINLNENFNFGAERINNIMAYARNHTNGARQTLIDLFRIDVRDDYVPDIDDLKPKSKTISLSEQMAVSKSVKEMKEYLEWERGNVND